MYRNLIWKIPDLSHLGPIWPTWGPKFNIPDVNSGLNHSLQFTGACGYTDTGALPTDDFDFGLDDIDDAPPEIDLNEILDFSEEEEEDEEEEEGEYIHLHQVSIVQTGPRCLSKWG